MLQPLDQLKLKRAQESLQSNLTWAEKFSHNPALEEKFLRQAIEAEAKINEIERVG